MVTTSIFLSAHSVIKKLLSRTNVIVTLLVLFSVSSLMAQENTPAAETAPIEERETQPAPVVTGVSTSSSKEKNEKNYFTVQDGEDTIVLQSINWQAESYVKWYEVSLEYLNDGEEWLPVTDAIYKNHEIYGDNPIPEYVGNGIYKTQANEIIVALKANPNGGSRKYRYTVSSYNLLNKKSFTSEVKEIEIHTAVFPHIESSNISSLYLDEAYDSTIRLSGRNFTDQTQFYLARDRKRIYPAKTEVEKNQRSAKITFNTDAFDMGEWLITAENPGEFTSSIPLNILYNKWYELYVSLGYAPTVFLYNDMTKNFFGNGMYFYGGDFKLTFIPFKRTSGYWGLSLIAKFHYLRRTVPIKNTDDSYTLDSFLTQAHLAFVYRYPIINNRLILDIHAGLGATGFNSVKFSYPNELYSENFNSFYISAIAGTSLSLRFWKNVSLLIGFDATYSYIPKLHPIQAIPVLGIELRF